MFATVRCHFNAASMDIVPDLTQPSKAHCEAQERLALSDRFAAILSQDNAPELLQVRAGVSAIHSILPSSDHGELKLPEP